MCSAALEHRAEGLVLGVGANMFKLAGSVIVFGVVAAFIIGIVYAFWALEVDIYERLGRQTWEYEHQPRIIGRATVVGPDEGKGPLSADFDYIYDNLEIGEKRGKKQSGNCWNKPPSWHW